MDSDEEFLQFSDFIKHQSPSAPERRLKRLRKATEQFPKDPRPAPSPDDSSLVNSSTFESLDGTRNLDGGRKEVDFEELNAGSGSQLEGFEEGNELDSGFDGSDVSEEGVSGAKRALAFDSLAEEFDGEGGDLVGTEVEEGDSRKLRTEQELDKKRKDLDGSDEPKQKTTKKKKKVKSATDSHDEMPYSAGSTKRGGDTERKDYLKELRAESQRLLRETRGASFEPVPLVQKSVSSLLEKIRQRKHELSKKSVVTNSTSFLDGNGTISRELVVDFDLEKSPIEDVGDHKAAEVDCEETTACFFDAGAILDAPSVQGSKGTSNDSHKNETSEIALDKNLKNTFRAPVDDTQDIDFDSQTSVSKHEMSSSPLEPVMAPSLLAMNLKLDSVPLDDFSSDEQDDDKENIDPHLQGSAGLPSSPKGDPVKAFVDDEAEEEDDSDNDLARFRDNEEDEDNMDSEELNDIIATEYEEKPIDNQIRNQLHQQWLEQQDATGTENLLQRLKCNSKQRETTLIEEEDEESEEEFLDDPFVSRNAVRMNLKKAKEMIPQMFTDKDDMYASSDDEETEKSLAKQHLSDKSEQQAMFLSPAEDEGSKEIFGLIKKLNAVPDTQRKAKISSSFHMLNLGGNRAMSSKSSFVHRGSKSSLPSFQKHGTSVVRSFVFERDDSNSRGPLSMAEDSSDLVQSENRRRKTASSKFSNSQVRSSAQSTQAATEKNSGPSLNEILRCPSLQSNHCNSSSMAGQVEAIYAAFKLDQNIIKKESSASVRTA